MRSIDLKYGSLALLLAIAVAAAAFAGAALETSAADDDNEGVDPTCTQLLITCIDQETGEFIPGGKFEITDDGGKAAARFEITEGEDGVPDISMIEAQDDITGGPYKEDADGETEDKPEEEDTEEGEVTVLDEDSDSAEHDKNADADDKSETDKNDDPAVDAKTADGSDTKYRFAMIKGLRKGVKYKLSEVRAPEGHTPHDVISFTMEESKRIVIENTVPRITSKALDSRTGDSIAFAGNDAWIKDTVSFVNLAPGRKYTLKGKLMYAGDDYADEEHSAVTVDGDLVIGTSTFSPTKPDGMTDVNFRFDAGELAGRAVVVFEELYLDDIPVIAHSDPFDTDQTVYIPEIETSASLTGNDINDTVKCRNLIRGRTYIARGWMADAATGEKIPASDGYTQFSFSGPGSSEDADDASMTRDIEIDVKMPIDPDEYSGKDLTAFERLYLVSGDDEIPVAEHCDLTDSSQTVTIAYVPDDITADPGGNTVNIGEESVKGSVAVRQTAAEESGNNDSSEPVYVMDSTKTHGPDMPLYTPKTGDNSRILIYLAVFGVSICVCLCLILNRNRRM